MRASSRRSETSPAEARTTTERALTGCATEREGHVSHEVVEETGSADADWGLVAAVRRWRQKKRPRRLTFAATAERATRALEAETRATGATTRRADMVAAILMLSAADYAIRAEHCGWHRGSDLPVTEPSPASGWVGFSQISFPRQLTRVSHSRPSF